DPVRASLRANQAGLMRGDQGHMPPLRSGSTKTTAVRKSGANRTTAGRPQNSSNASPISLRHPQQFLKAAQFVIGLFAKQDGPIRVCDLSNIDAASRIDRNTVRRDELAGTFAQRLGAEVGENFPFG